MSKNIKKPKMRPNLIWNEVSKRTGCPVNNVKDVIGTYIDIVEECLLAGVECPCGRIGTFSFVEIEPKEKVDIYNPFDNSYKGCVDIPGYKRLSLRISPTWKKELRELSKNAPWEKKENGKEN